MTAAAIELPELECVATILPTKANLVNFFGGLATHAEKMAMEEVEELKEEGEKLKKILDDVRKLLGPYDPEFERISIPEKEWEIMITRLVQEYDGYVQAMILDLINNIIPFEFKTPILGIEIDVLKLVTDPEYVKEIRKEISGFGADIQAKIDALDPSLVGEELEAEIEKLRKGKLDALYELLPAEYRTFMGDFGLEVDELKKENIFSYIKTEIKKYMNGGLFAIFDLLISKFDVIWDALGLPELPIPLTLDVDQLIKDAIEHAKDEAEQYVALQSIEIAGFNIMDLLGGDFDDNIDSLEFKIARIKEEIREFKEDWQMYLLKKWMELVTKFFEAIGLGALVDWITFDFCDFMKLIGIPTEIDLSEITGITTKTNSPSGLVPAG